MKVGIITILSSLLLALPALAGPSDPCAGQPDTDSDGVCDIIDNCSSTANASQTDGDQDGYGDVCDCDFSTSANGACDGADFASFGSQFGTTVPPTNCEFDLAPNGAIDARPEVASGVNTRGGEIVHPAVRDALAPA